MTGELQKLEIRSYTDPKLLEEKEDGPELASGGSSFKVYVNPEKYTQTYKAEYADAEADGKTSGGGLKYKRTAPENLELELLFDRTGVIHDSPYKKNGIVDDIKALRSFVMDYNSDIHRPPYLKVIWGSLIFIGFATELNIDYKLFQNDGAPLRATVKLVIKQFTDQEKTAAKENKKSPDLTHLRMVKEGDTLPLLCNKIYGDSKYYLEVARANKLNKFRNLTPGTQLLFPPIDNIS